MAKLVFKIREGEDGPWQSIERYVSHRTGSSFSHGVCPECEGRWLLDMKAARTRK